MCFILHIATKRRLDRIPLDQNNKHLCIDDIHGNPEQIQSHFSLPEIAYVGSSLGCGCGFRSVCFGIGRWSGEWEIANGDCEPPENHIQDHQELYDLVTSQIDEDGGVELYGYWDGDEKEATEQEENIPASLLLDHSFWFRHRGIYRITTDEQDGDHRVGPQAQNWEKLAHIIAEIARSEQLADGKGKGVPEDDVEAVKWYRKSAEQGNADAQYNLGVCYKHGIGVPKDDAEAVKWYLKSAEQGDAKAQYNLGDCYHKGNGVPKDDVEAVKWYRKSAEQGNADAQYYLGVCYEYGYGVPKDHAESLKWYLKPAEQTGQDNEKTCISCGETNPGNLEFCWSCGNSLSAPKNTEQADGKTPEAPQPPN